MNQSITHIVICWLKKHGNTEDRKQLIEAAKILREIPGIIDLRVGKVFSSSKLQVDSSYDIALSITFKDENTFREYETHPIHKKAVQEALAPLVSKFVVYDFENE